MKNELSQKLDRLKSVCVDVGAIFLNASIHNVLDQCYLDINESDFLTLIAREKPSAVFFEATPYDPDRFIRGTMAAEGWKESWEHDPQSIWPTPDEIKSELRTELKEVEDQIGLPRYFMATYAIAAGQHRVCWITTEWSEDISEKIVQILDSRHDRVEKEESELAIELDKLINEVANDPEFQAIRGRPKRLLFLQKKYGDRVPPHPRGRMASPGQNCNLVDFNIATVLTKADDLYWSERL